MALSHTYPDEFTASRGVLYMIGLFYILIGIIALIVPTATSIALELIIGALLLAGGLVEGYYSWRFRHQRGFWSFALPSLLAIAAGVFMLLFPYIGVVALTLVLAVLFGVGGVARMVYAWNNRDERGWGWLMASGVVSLILMGVILFGLPPTAYIALGILFGVNMLIAGVTLFAFGRAFEQNHRNDHTFGGRYGHHGGGLHAPG